MVVGKDSAPTKWHLWGFYILYHAVCDVPWSVLPHKVCSGLWRMVKRRSYGAVLTAYRGIKRPCWVAIFKADVIVILLSYRPSSSLFIINIILLFLFLFNLDLFLIDYFEPFRLHGSTYIAMNTFTIVLRCQLQATVMICVSSIIRNALFVKKWLTFLLFMRLPSYSEAIFAVGGLRN